MKVEGGEKVVLNSTTPRTAAVKQRLIDKWLVTRCCKLSYPAALWAGSEPMTCNDYTERNARSNENI